MKRIGYLIEKVADMDNLLLAFHKAQRGKACKQEVRRFRTRLQDNLMELQSDLLTGDVSVGHYRTFMIRDPKKRKICSSSFGERVLHHALMNVCQPYFDKHLIYDTYATRLGKGTYAALDKAHRAMRRYHYVGKLDIRKYFDSIDHNKLKQQLERMFKDSCLLTVFCQIIDTYDCGVSGKGLPIGNLTSQFFANHYLSVFDHYVKEVLRIPVYVRYMDDMLLFDNDKCRLTKMVEIIKNYLSNQLILTLKAPQIVSSTQGVSFLGYRLQGNRIGLNSRSRNRFVRKSNLYVHRAEKGLWSQEECRIHLVPMLSFVEKAYTKHFRKNILQSQTEWLEPRESWRQLEQQR